MSSKISEIKMRPWPLVVNSSQFQLSEEIEKLKKETENLFQSISTEKEKAVQSGFQEGMRKAKEENSIGFINFLKDRELEINNLIEDFKKHIPQIIANLSSEFIGSELSSNPKALESRIKLLLNQIPNSKHFLIKVNKADLPKIEQTISKMKDVLQYTRISVETDENLIQGDIIIHTENGILDGSLRTFKKNAIKLLSEQQSV